jgi:hypothetical protein
MGVITLVLSLLYGSDYSGSVDYLLNGIPYRVADDGRYLTYAVGNPMGVKAS